jgi:MFS family permease
MAYAAPHHGFRTFVIVWLAQSLSVIGSGMTGFALNVYLAQVLYPAPEQKPELALAFTVLNLGFTIPFVFGGPLAGAWADRHDRKQIMIVTNTANGLISLLTVFLMLSGSLQLSMLVSIGVLAAAAGAFHLAAFDASYAMLVPDSLLPRANGMMQTTWSISGIVSPALAALIIALPALLPRGVGAAVPVAWMGNGTPLVIAIDALTFFLCTAVLLLVHVPSPTRSDLTTGGRIEQSLWADVREGAIYIRHRPPLLWLVATFSVANLALAPAGVIIPLLCQVQPRGQSDGARLYLRNCPCPAWRRRWRRRHHWRPAGHHLGRAEAEACLWRPHPDTAGGRPPGRLRIFAACARQRGGRVLWCCDASGPERAFPGHLAILHASRTAGTRIFDPPAYCLGRHACLNGISRRARRRARSRIRVRESRIDMGRILHRAAF